MKPSDLDNPLAQFNHTLPDKDSMKQLLATINKELDDKKLDDRILDQVFDTYWESFEKKFNDAIKKEPPIIDNAPKRTGGDILEEILDTTRTLDKRIRDLERSYKRTNRFKYQSPNQAEWTEALVSAFAKRRLSDEIFPLLMEKKLENYTSNNMKENLLYDITSGQDIDNKENT